MVMTDLNSWLGSAHLSFIRSLCTDTCRSISTIAMLIASIDVLIVYQQGGRQDAPMISVEAGVLRCEMG